MFQGKAQPSPSTLGSTDTATLNAVAEHKWLLANQDLWSVLLLTTSGSANNTVKTFEGKRPEDGAGHEQLARKALTEKCNGHTKEARRVCHEKLVNTKMEPGQGPDDFFFVLEEYRDLLEEMRHTVHDERYEDIILQALQPEYEGFEPPDTRGGTLGWTTFGTWYTLCTWTTFRALPTLNRSQAAALPCRWWGTPAVTYSATTSNDMDTSRRTAPS